MDKQVFESIIGILQKPHEHIIYGDERINTQLFDLQQQCLTLIQCLTFKFSDKQHKEKQATSPTAEPDRIDSKLPSYLQACEWLDSEMKLADKLEQLQEQTHQGLQRDLKNTIKQLKQLEKLKQKQSDSPLKEGGDGKAQAREL